MLTLSVLLALLLPASAAIAANARSTPAAGKGDVAYVNADKAIAQTKTAMMGDPATALVTARRAVALAEKLPDDKRGMLMRATAMWLEGEAQLGLNDMSGASATVDQALYMVGRVAPGTKLNGDLLRSRGAIQAARGDVVAALASYQKAFSVFQQADVERSQALALLDIGQIYSDAGDSAKALEYYRRSAQTYSKDAGLALPQQNNQAEVFRKMRRFNDAAKSYQAALAAAASLDSPLLEVRILTNLANAQIGAGQLDAAHQSVNQALKLSARGEAAGWRNFVFGAEARVAAERGNIAQAAALFRRTFEGVELSKSDMLYKEYHEAASRIFEATGENALALAHFRAFQRLESESHALTASAAAQLASAQFDFAAQNLRIEKLQREQLQRDIALERQRANFRNTLFTGLLIAGGAIFSVLLVGFLSVRRSRNEVRDANETLSLTNAKLGKALAAKTEFLAMTSHEIRTPLNGILGMTSVLLADRTIKEETRSRIEVVNSAGETMRALVDDILDVAKMENGEISLAHEPTDMRAILEEARRLWSGLASQKNIELQVDCIDLPAEIMGDAGRLRQIIFNLMSNALKFTQQGKVQVTATARPVSDHGEEMVIAVADSGIGIAPDKHELIFESFRQVDAATTRQYSGTGLGLAICRKLVTAMGGHITVESALGEGATFTVCLPIERTARGNADGHQETTLSRLGELAALVVIGDGPEHALLKMELLTSFARVEMISGIEGAQAALASAPHDLVLVDCAVLQDDIADPLAQVRRLIEAAGPHPVSLLVAPDGKLPIASAMMSGAAQVVVRPIETAALLEALAGLFGPAPEMFVAPSLAA